MSILIDIFKIKVFVLFIKVFFLALLLDLLCALFRLAIGLTFF